MIVRAEAVGAIAEAAAILRRGGLIGLPTETVYGLAADATDAAAVARIYAAKGRPRFNPLIAHVAGLDQAAAEAELGPAALALAQRFWPGPLTIVAPRKAGGTVCDLACAGLDTIALRVPAHPTAQAVIAALGRPIAAPSANRSGHVSPTNAAHVAQDLAGAVDLILDGGPCLHGLESTIIAAPSAGPCVLLRPGALPRAAIEAVAGPLAALAADGGVTAPGMTASHYAPRARLRLDAADPQPGETYLAFGPDGPPGAANLSPRADLIEAAARLYALLRELDAAGPAVIAVAPILGEGLGEAIRDRLARAAAPR